jgi:hypothetical protein
MEVIDDITLFYACMGFAFMLYGTCMLTLGAFGIGARGRVFKEKVLEVMGASAHVLGWGSVAFLVCIVCMVFVIGYGVIWPYAMYDMIRGKR